MNRYEAYQDTGYEWIGEIPKQWQLSKAGKFFTERSEKVDDITYPPLSVTMSGIVDQLSDVAKTNDGENRKLVKKDDFVINSRSDRKGSSGIAPRDGSVSLINIVLEPKGIHPQFIEHLFKSYYFKEEYFRNGKGIHWDLWTTRWDQFKNINIPIPSIEEQKRISRYLDKKTNQIDSLIEKIQKKIALLKEQRTSLINDCVTKGLDSNVEMRDSGVEWIGSIPKHWTFLPLKRLLEDGRDAIRTGPFGSELKTSDYVDSGVRVYNQRTVYDDDYISGDLYVSLEKYESLKGFETHSGDLLLTTRGTIGRVSVVPDNAEIGIIHPCLIRFRVNLNLVNKDYLVWFINRSSLFITNVLYESNSTTIEVIYSDTLKEIKIPLPPLKEQKETVDYLNEKIKSYDLLLDLMNKKVDLFKEYRQSLISSVVIGKLKITENML